MTVPREHPYIWTTWLPRLLTGDNSCEWAVWFTAHYQDWTRQPSDFNQAQWLLSHTALLNQQKQEKQDRGHDVYVEGQNAFRLRGKSATLAGRPDLVVVDRDDALIIDVKTGREQPWHAVQVMIYQYALPKALPQYRNARLASEIVYLTRTVQVPRGGLDNGFIQALGALIGRLTSERPARQVPCAQECRYCDITAADCAERVHEGSERDGGTTHDF